MSRKWHHWTGAEEQMIRDRYQPGIKWGQKELAEEFGVSVSSMQAHIDEMRRHGRL